MSDSQSTSSLAISVSYRRYALLVLMGVYTLNYMDRQIVSILAVPIKRELGLLDWQIGMMTGLAFALLYTVAGFPVARLSERGNRPVIIGTATAIWSIFTTLCGFAQNFVHLLLLRVGVGVGEAGCMPPAVSLIADYTTPKQRPFAMATFLAGAPVGSLLGMAIGGVLADLWGWRIAFIVVGAPGVLFALIVVGTLIEPRRLATASGVPSLQDHGFFDVLRLLRGKRSYWLLVGGITSMGCVSYGASAFLPSFFSRVHAAELQHYATLTGMSPLGLLGIVLGLTTGGAGICGTLVGGALADRLAKGGPARLMRVPAYAAICACPLWLATVFSHDIAVTFALLVVPTFLGTMYLGPSYAAVQGLMPPRMRATATALMLFIVNLIGLGGAPFAIGLVSDLATAKFGAGLAGLQWALAANSGCALLGAAFFMAAAPSLVRDSES